MQFEVMRCSAFMYHQKYIEFILDSYSDLNLPYPFSVSLHYISSPILLGGEVFLALDDENNVVGAISLIRGTADQDYRNHEIIQLQIAYISKPYRSSSMLQQLLTILTQYFTHLDVPIQELRFWSQIDPYLVRLITKRIAIEPKFHETMYGPLHEYRIPFTMLTHYISQFQQERYF